MRSSQLLLYKYDSDKITNLYMNRYDMIFDHLVDKKIILLELGVLNGGSLLLWHDYFPLGSIVGIDINLSKEFKSADRIHTYEGSQVDTKFLSRVANEIAPDGFDIIIDDASHLGELTKIAFWHLFDNHLKPDGIYVIEDWGTGYWDDWPDGKSLNFDSYISSDVSPNPEESPGPMPCHSYGMVGFIKQLVDEQGARDASRQQLQGTTKRDSKFESLTITPSIVIVKKAR